jgi:hypothetical protein
MSPEDIGRARLTESSVESGKSLPLRESQVVKPVQKGLTNHQGRAPTMKPKEKKWTE